MLDLTTALAQLYGSFTFRLAAKVTLLFKMYGPLCNLYSSAVSQKVARLRSVFAANGG